MVNAMTLFEHAKIIEVNSELMKMDFVQTIEEYLNFLAGLRVERKDLFSNDLNILENFSRHLEESLNIVNNFKSRFEQAKHLWDYCYI